MKRAIIPALFALCFAGYVVAVNATVAAISAQDQHHEQQDSIR